ncbi:MAG: tripartite tricarboxylate transporter TctB family protein [Burkholderiaceae bacterium]
MRVRSASPDVAGVVGCLILIAAGIAAIVYSGDFSTLGSIFPRTISGLMIGLGIVYLLLALLGRTTAGEASEGSMARRAGVALVMLAWAFALGPIGFLASSAVAMVLLLVIANHERWGGRSVLVYGLV